MTLDRLRSIFVVAFVLAFFAYLFMPLAIMSLSAFNSASFPRVHPWDCFTVEWFRVLANDTKLMNGLRNSLFIGVGVVAVSVPLGLAGALLLTQASPRVRPTFYAVLISPILIPGVVLGISTLIFWDRLGMMFGARYDSLFYDGIFLTILGQSSFVSAYAMLVFISRLQRFDPALEEAALDLGATHVQAFRKVMLPFLKPAIGSAAVLAFLASFENYNTTIFTSLSSETLTTVLASKVRLGLNPSISSLAVIIVAITLFFAVAHEIARRRQAAREHEAERVAAGGGSGSLLPRRALLLEPAMLMLVVIFVAGLGTVYFAGTVGVDECKVHAAEQRRLQIEQRIRERERQQMFQSAEPGAATPASPAAPPAPAAGSYQGIFAPGNLTGESAGQSDTDEDTTTPRGNQNLFAPRNLRGEGELPAEQPTPKPATEGNRNLFAPENLLPEGNPRPVRP